MQVVSVKSVFPRPVWHIGKRRPADPQLPGCLCPAGSAAAKTSSAVTQTRVGAQAITGAAQNVMADSQAVNAAMVPLINNVTKNLPTLQKQARNLVSVTGTLQNPNGDSVIKIHTTSQVSLIRRLPLLRNTLNSPAILITLPW